MTQPAPLCLVTRPEPDASRFAARVEAELGLPTLTSPLMRIEALDATLPPNDFAGVILTSAHAARLLTRFNVPLATSCFAVGTKTAEVAENLGYGARSMGGNADRLVASLIANPPPGPLLHLRGEHSRGDVAARLIAAGIPTEECVAYRQVSQGLSHSAQAAIAGKAAMILPLFSPRTATLASAVMTDADSLYPVALSEAVAHAARFPRAEATVISSAPTEDAMIAAIARTSPARAWVEKAGLQS